MNYSPASPCFRRDQALEWIQNGKEVFSKYTDYNRKEKGYQLFKKGIGEMITYAKLEKNEEVVDKVKDKLQNWLREAQEMDKVIKGDTSDTSETSEHHEQPTSFNLHHANGIKDSPVKVPYDDHEKKSTPHTEKPRKTHKVSDSELDKLEDNLVSAIITEKPNILWNDIAGLDSAKKALQEAVILPIRYPELFVGMRTPWKGILLYGPPGTGKTYLAKACATEANSTFFAISSSDVMSKWVGESEKLIKTLFKMAREKKPAIIFIDEIDSILSSRNSGENEATRRVKTEFLVQMQGLGHDDTGILVLGATNIPWAIDSAARRRFEKRIYIPLPDLKAREAILRKLLSKTPNSLTADEIFYIAEKTEGFSCADVNVYIRDACFEPIRRAENATHFKVIGTLTDGNQIYQPCAPSDPNAEEKKMFEIPAPQLKIQEAGMDDFESALLRAKSSVGRGDLKLHEEFTKNFGIEG
jgi:vacuolar protein-sorting-associated protein 4